jgi:hypothetical protein
LLLQGLLVAEGTAILEILGFWMTGRSMFVNPKSKIGSFVNPKSKIQNYHAYLSSNRPRYRSRPDGISSHFEHRTPVVGSVAAEMERSRPDI